MAALLRLLSSNLISLTIILDTKRDATDQLPNFFRAIQTQSPQLAVFSLMQTHACNTPASGLIKLMPGILSSLHGIEHLTINQEIFSSVAHTLPLLPNLVQLNLPLMYGVDHNPSAPGSPAHCLLAHRLPALKTVSGCVHGRISYRE
jgi:hypothetical protein